MLKKIKESLSLPLLTKELNVLANRKSTYIVRAVYGGLLFFMFLLMLYQHGFGRSNVNSLFYNIYAGQLGMNFFNILQLLQVGSVFLFLPGMMASAITVEKEKNTLELLFTTRLTSWNIILEKFLSRLLPFIYLLLMSLPLMGVIYSLGGVGRGVVLTWLGTIFVLTFFTGALSLLISVFSRSTTGAILGAYFFNAIPMFFLLESVFRRRNIGTVKKEFIDTWYLAVTFVLGIIFLFFAKKNLVKKALTRKRSFWRRLLLKIDKDAVALNDVVAGGVVVVKDRQKMPADKPVLWREKKRMNIDTFRYCFRLALIFGLPCLLVGMCLVGSKVDDCELNHIVNVLSAMLVICYWVYVTVSYSTSVLNDLSSQTMDVLLTTPISAADYIKEKMAAGNKLIIVFCIILLIPTSIKIINMHYNFGRLMSIPILLLSTFIFLTFLRNLTLVLSLWFKNRSKVIVWGFCFVLLLQIGGFLLYRADYTSNLGIKKGGIMILAVPEFVSLTAMVENFIDRGPYYYRYGGFSYKILRERSLYCSYQVILWQLLSCGFYLFLGMLFKRYIIKNSARLLDRQYYLPKAELWFNIFMFFGGSFIIMYFFLFVTLNLFTIIGYIVVSLFIILLLFIGHKFIVSKNKKNKKKMPEHLNKRGRDSSGS